MRASRLPPNEPVDGCKKSTMSWLNEWNGETPDVESAEVGRSCARTDARETMLYGSKSSLLLVSEQNHTSGRDEQS